VIESDYCQWLAFFKASPSGQLALEKRWLDSQKHISPGAGDDQPDSGLKAYSGFARDYPLAARIINPAWYIPAALHRINYRVCLRKG